MNSNCANGLDSFIKYLDNNGYKKATINAYYFAIKNFFNYLNKNKINNFNFTNDDIKKYKEYIEDKNSKQTINAKIYAIRKYIDYLSKEKNITINHNVEIIKTKNKKDIIPIRNIEKILNYINEISKKEITCERDKLLIKMLYYTGCRTKEILGIKKDNINKDSLNLKGRSIILNKSLLDDINNFTKKYNIRNGQYLFFSFAKQKLNFNSHMVEKSVEDIFNRCKKIINDKLSIRDLRNSQEINLKERSINTKINKIHTHRTIKFNGDYLKFISSRRPPPTP